MTNREAREEMEMIFGKECFIEKLHIKERYKNITIQKPKYTGSKKKYKGRKQRKKMEVIKKRMTYHHIVEKHCGGNATIANGALLSNENHEWFNFQSKEIQQQINLEFQAYKINFLLSKLYGDKFPIEDISLEPIDGIQKNQENDETQNNEELIRKMDIANMIDDIVDFTKREF